MELEQILSSSVLARLTLSHRFAVLTGAGVSAESGVATFRDPNGLWSRFRPNPAHRALAQLESLVPEFTLITQNVDRLHQRAGSRNVLELHGNLEKNHCSRCGAPYEDEINDDQPPRCPACGGFVRPSVVWFGELLPADVLLHAEQVARCAEVFLVVGTSAEVYPAAALPRIAWESGATLIEVNPSPTPLSVIAHATIREKAGIALPALVQLIAQLRTTDGME
jgi:NAD-dependent deacetylase